MNNTLEKYTLSHHPVEPILGDIKAREILLSRKFSVHLFGKGAKCES